MAGSESLALDGDDVQGAVEVAVAASVEAVPGGHAGRGGDRSHPAEHREGALAADASRVGPHDQGRCGDDGSNPDQLEQVGPPALDQRLDVFLVCLGFRAEGGDAPGEGLHGVTDCDRRHIAGRAPAGADVDDLCCGAASKPRSEDFRAGVGK